MDITPKQFNVLLAELKKIREHLDQKWHEQIAAINSAEESREKNRHVKPFWVDQILAEYKQPEANRKAETQEQTRIQKSLKRAAWCTFFATAAAFGAAAYYAHYARLTFKEIQRQTPEIQKSANAAKGAADTANNTLINSQKTFELDQRPYMIADTEHPVFAMHGLVANKPLTVNVNFKNIGKEPAIQQVAEMHLLLYESDLTLKTAEANRLRLRAFTDKWFEKMRGDANKATKEAVDYANGHGQDVAPGETYFASTHDSYTLSPTQLAAVMKDTDPDSVLLLFIVITYTDRFNNRYETDSCRMYFGSHTELWHRCQVYNIIR